MVDNSPIRDIKALRAQLQQNHIQQVRVKIDLATTLLELSGAEFANGDIAAGEKYLIESRTAVFAARRGLCLVTSAKHRERFMERISELKIEIEQAGGIGRSTARMGAG